MQSLNQALYLAFTGKSRSLAGCITELAGKPVGGWAETQQAKRHIRDELPVRSMRAYTLDEFISAAYIVDSSDRYRTRES
jgi:hypothetical protein